MPERIAYSYRRCSHVKQKKGRSLDRQDFAEQVCKRHGWRLNTEFRLVDDGRSGWTGENRLIGALGRFIEAVKDETVQPGAVLIIEDVDRFSREQVSVAMQTFLDLVNRGIGLYIQTTEVLYDQKTIKENPNILFLPIGSLIRANEESNRKSGLLGDVWKDKREKAGKGIPTGKTCPGYLQLNRDKGCYEFRPDRLAVLREMVGWALDGLGGRRIAGRLNQRGEPCWGTGKEWQGQFVNQVLTSRALVGEYQPMRRQSKNKRVPAGDPVPGYYPAALTEEEYARLQVGIRGRGNDTGPKGEVLVNLFTGLAHDPAEGCNLRIQYKGRAGQPAVYLTSAAGAAGGLAGTTSVRYQPFETAVLRYMRELTPADLTGKAEPDEVSSLQTLLAARRADLAALEEQLASPGGASAAGARAAARIEKECDELDGRLKDAESRRRAGNAGFLQQTQDVIAALAGAQGEALDNLRTRLKARLRELVDRIDVTVELKGKEERRCYATIRFAAGGERGIWFDVLGGKLGQSGLWTPAHDFAAADLSAL